MRVQQATHLKAVSLPCIGISCPKPSFFANNQDPNTEIPSSKYLKGLLLCPSLKDAGQDLPNHQWQHLFAPGILLVADNRICFLISIPKITEDSRCAGRQAWIGKGNLYLLDAATLCPASVLGYQPASSSLTCYSTQKWGKDTGLELSSYDLGRGFPATFLNY